MILLLKCAGALFLFCLRENLNKGTKKLADLLSSSSFLIFESVYSDAWNPGQTLAHHHAASTTNGTCGDGQVTYRSPPDATPCPHGPQTEAGGSHPSVGPGTWGGHEEDRQLIWSLQRTIWWHAQGSASPFRLFLSPAFLLLTLSTFPVCWATRPLDSHHKEEAT